MDIRSVPVSVMDLLCLCSILLGLNGVFGDREKTAPVRFEDIPFPRETKILNKTITCAESNWGKFTTITYTCDDIKVDGLRLAYGYYPGWGVDENCQETKGGQELTQLCKLMLKSVDKHHKGVYGTFVNNATCRYTPERRFLFQKRKKPRRYKWSRMEPGNGWLSSISCMINT